MTSLSGQTPTTPPLVELAQRLIADGVPWLDAAGHIQDDAAGHREALQAAVLHQVQTMRRRPSDDHEAGAVLRALERALASTPRRGPGQT